MTDCSRFSFSQGFQQALHILRQRRRISHFMAARRMNETNRLGVQGLPGHVEILQGAVSIHRIADNRMVNVLHMHPDLMRSPGFELHMEKRVLAELFDDPVDREGFASAIAIYGHFFTILAVAADLSLNLPLKFAKTSVGDGRIHPTETSIL